MVGITAAIIGGSLIGAGANLISGSKAAKAQRKSAELGAAEQRRQFDLSRADMMPWMNVGRGALDRLAAAYGIAGSNGTVDTSAGPYGGFTASPGYQFRLDQGVQAVERSAAARGLLRSGAAAKAIQRYGEGLAASEYDAFANRLAQMAGLGQAATAQTGALGANAATNISNALIASGNARASSYANIGSSVNSGLNNLLSAYLYSKGGGFGG